MKKKYSPFFASMLFLAAAAGCGVTEEELSPDRSTTSGKTYPAHFVADEIETRTAFGEAETANGTTSYPTLWTVNDSEVAVSLNLGGAKVAEVIPSEDFKMATFDAEFDETDVAEQPYTFYALSPFSAYIGSTPSHGGFRFNILTEQTPLATSCDEGAQVMASSKEVGSIAGFSSVELQFSHVTAYGKMTLSGVTLPDGAEIQSIELTASVPFAGEFYYNFGQESLEESASSRTITLRPDNIVENGTLGDIWFACAPADLGGGTLKVDVNTSVGILSRTVEIPEGRLAFERGRVSKFSVNMSSATFTETVDRWVLVTDASTLAAGDEIIIASSATAGAAAYAISTTQNNNNRGRTSITIAEEGGQKIIQNPGSDVEVFKLVTGYYNGYYYLQEVTSSTGRYLYSTNSTSNNYLRSADPSTATNSTNRSYSNWVINISNSNSKAYISTNGSYRSGSRTYYKQIRQYESGDNFSAYGSTNRSSWSNTSTSGTSDVYIYRKEAHVSLDADPILEASDYGAYLTGGNRVFGAGDQLSREYPDNGTVTFAILKPSAYEVVEFKGIPVDPAKGDSFTLNYDRISGYTHSAADYVVTVVKVDGPKVWLTTGSGEGFIVKK